jgi:hypothetical protein
METMQMRALRAATGGVQEGRMQNEGAARGDKPLQNARNTEKAKPVRNDRQRRQIGLIKG